MLSIGGSCSIVQRAGGRREGGGYRVFNPLFSHSIILKAGYAVAQPINVELELWTC